MTTPPGENYDSEAVSGNPGPASRGTAERTSEKDTATSGAGGGGAVPPPPPVAPHDTSGTDGVNKPSGYDPVDTSYTGTFETTLPGVSTAHPAYRKPDYDGTPGTIADTSRTDHLGDGTPPPATQVPWMTGTEETANVGAPGGVVSTVTETGKAIDATTPITLADAGVIVGSVTVAKVTTTSTPVTGESHVIQSASDFTLTHAPVTTAAASLVVKKGSTTLVMGTDYTATATGSGATANFNIRRVGTSSAVADGDTVTVDYSYNATGQTALTAGTDYTVSYASSGAGTTATVLRKSASANVANGDLVNVTYRTGDAEYFDSNIPTAAPAAPMSVTATGHSGYVTVAWAAPTSGEQIDGYRVESNTGGVYFAPANTTSYDFHQLTPDVPYTFRVAAVNARGNGPFSAWTSPATATNPNVPG